MMTIFELNAYIWTPFFETAWGVRDRLQLWRDRLQQRRCLAGFDDRSLADAGITRAQQDGECNKPFWRP